MDTSDCCMKPSECGEFANSLRGIRSTQRPRKLGQLREENKESDSGPMRVIHKHEAMNPPGSICYLFIGIPRGSPADETSPELGGFRCHVRRPRLSPATVLVLRPG